MEQLSVELQAHLQGRQKEEQREWLHYFSQERVSKVLMQVTTASHNVNTYLLTESVVVIKVFMYHYLVYITCTVAGEFQFV